MRKEPILRRELQILKRLREARDRLGLDQKSFAQQVGISRGRLANYEYSKAPLPSSLALKICHQFILGEKWLATGKGPFRQLLELRYHPVAETVPDRMSFGEAYLKFYSPVADEIASDLAKNGSAFRVHSFARIFQSNRAFVRNYLIALVDYWMEELTDDMLPDFADHLGEAGNKLAGQVLDIDYREDEESGVVAPFSKTTGQKISWDDSLTRLFRIRNERMAKSGTIPVP